MEVDKKTHKIDKFLALARTLATYSNVYRFKHGSCIVKRGRIIAQGTNQYKSHPLQRQYNISQRQDIINDAPHYIHAEISALTKVKNIDLSDAEIYVYRLSLTGRPAISRPCAACMQAIIDSGIKKIIYTTNLGVAQEVISREIAYNFKKKHKTNK